jgi:hypothetical protein
VRLSLAGWWGRLDADPTYAFRWFAALGAAGVTLIGVAPMTAAATDPNADPILARAVNGPPEVTNIPTPAFDLVDQHGRRVSLAGLHGTTVGLVFVDPGCIQLAEGCVSAQEVRLADRVLGATANRVELIGIDTNPLYQDPQELVMFDRLTGLDKMGNWL